jgi:hypothetical protein
MWSNPMQTGSDERDVDCEPCVLRFGAFDDAARGPSVVLTMFPGALIPGEGTADDSILRIEVLCSVPEYLAHEATPPGACVKASDGFFIGDLRRLCEELGEDGEGPSAPSALVGYSQAFSLSMTHMYECHFRRCRQGGRTICSGPLQDAFLTWHLTFELGS